MQPLAKVITFNQEKTCPIIISYFTISVVYSTTINNTRYTFSSEIQDWETSFIALLLYDMILPNLSQKWNGASSYADLCSFYDKSLY